jgi:hypothetical protein
MLFFAANLLMAAVLAAPMHQAIREHLGASRMGEELARGFSMAWLTEFQIVYAQFLKSFSSSIVYAGVLFLLLNTVLSAGAFEVFFRGAGARMHAFGRGMGRYFFRFLRLAIIASLLYFIAFWLLQDRASVWLDGAFRFSTTERAHYLLDWLRIVLLIATVFSVNALVDYARAAIVTRDHQSVLGALGEASGFVLDRLGRVMAIYSALVLLAGLLIVLYAAFARYFPQSNVLTILLWFLVAQALLWARWAVRVAHWAAATKYFLAHVAAEITLPAEQPPA